MIKKNSKLNQESQSADFNIYDLIPSRFIPIEDDCERVYCNLCDRIFKNDIVTIKKHWFNCSSLNKSFKDKGPSGYQCHNCKTDVINVEDFNNHVLTESHTKICHGSMQYSFHGRKNNIMIYAPADIIKKCMRSEGINHCNSVPILSKFMNLVLDEFKLKQEVASKWYACIPCNLYDKRKVHSKKGCYNCRTHYYCASCNIEFICAEYVYNNHVYSCEHILIANKIKAKIGTSDENPKMVKLPQIILNGFKFEKNMAICKICHKQCGIDEREIMIHTMYRCSQIYHNLFKIVANSTKMTDYYFKCLVCRCEFHLLVTWKLHVLSPLHLSRCYQNDSLRSDFCDTCCAHFYGDADSTCCNHSIPNNHKKISSVSKFMADLYKERDFNSNDNRLTYNELSANFEKPRDFDVDNLKMVMSYSDCSTCNAAFYSSPKIYNRHTLTAEHIVLAFSMRNRQHMEFSEFSRIPLTNFVKYFQTKMEKLNILDDDNDKVIQTPSYYCRGCDFVTDKQSLWETHNTEIDDNEKSSGRSVFYCQICHMHMSGIPGDLDVHITTDQHRIMNDLQNLLENVENDSTERTMESGANENIDSVTEEKLSEDDKCYLLYVGHRLKQIKDDSVKLKVKLSIDDIFCKSMKYSDL